MISIIVPTYNEIKSNFIEKIFKNLALLKNAEVIIVDGGSSDGTIEKARQYPFKVLEDRSHTRAGRINRGIREAKWNLVLLHHPRSLLDNEGIRYLDENQHKFYWGGFTHRFNSKHYLLRFTSWYSNQVRGKLREIFYLDHCIFLKKELLHSLSYLPEIAIFEDTILSLELRKKAPAKLLPFSSTTSSVRFKKNGPWKQAIVNQWLKIRFYCGVDLTHLNKIYESNTHLNNDYR